MRLLDFIGLTVSFFIIFYFGDKGSAFWKAVICEKGKHFSRSSPPGHAAVRRCGGRECSDRVRDSGVLRRGGCAALLGGKMSK